MKIENIRLIFHLPVAGTVVGKKGIYTDVYPDYCEIYTKLTVYTPCDEVDFVLESGNETTTIPDFKYCSPRRFLVEKPGVVIKGFICDVEQDDKEQRLISEHNTVECIFEAFISGDYAFWWLDCKPLVFKEDHIDTKVEDDFAPKIMLWNEYISLREQTTKILNKVYNKLLHKVDCDYNSTYLDDVVRSMLWLKKYQPLKYKEIIKAISRTIKNKSLNRKDVVDS